MKKTILLGLLAVSTIANAQLDMTVPEEVLAEMTKKESESFSYKVVYPENYDANKEYPVVLGLSGGGQTEDIVDYCYYVMYRSDYFKKDFITVMPIAPEGKNFRTYSATEIKAMTKEIRQNENATDEGWIVIGTSNGGVASFNYASVEPKLYDGLFAMPGGTPLVVFPEEWKKYKAFVISTGLEDIPDWQSFTKETADNIKETGVNVTYKQITGQGHVFSPEYDVDQIYKLYFER